jgi:hypothetical protein
LLKNGDGASAGVSDAGIGADAGDTVLPGSIANQEQQYQQQLGNDCGIQLRNGSRIVHGGHSAPVTCVQVSAELEVIVSVSHRRQIVAETRYRNSRINAFRQTRSVLVPSVVVHSLQDGSYMYELEVPSTTKEATEETNRENIYGEGGGERGEDREERVEQ